MGLVKKDWGGGAGWTSVRMTSTRMGLDKVYVHIHSHEVVCVLNDVCIGLELGENWVDT